MYRGDLTGSQQTHRELKNGAMHHRHAGTLPFSQDVSDVALHSVAVGGAEARPGQSK